MIQEYRFLHEGLTHKIIGVSFEVMNELGTGYLEAVYHKALEMALRAVGLNVRSEVPLQVYFRGEVIGNYKADLIVDDKVLVELKALRNLTGEHKAQAINYLRGTGLSVGLVINFGYGKVDTARVYNPLLYVPDEV